MTLPVVNNCIGTSLCCAEGHSVISDSAFPQSDTRCKGKIQATLKEGSKVMRNAVQKIDEAVEAEDEHAEHVARRFSLHT